MATLKIERGQKAQVKVTKIDLCVKTVPFRTGIKCRHDIHVQNSAGDTAVCETFTPEGMRPDFVEGIVQWVQCVAVSPAPHFTMDIQPTEPPIVMFAPDGQKPATSSTYSTAQYCSSKKTKIRKKIAKIFLIPPHPQGHWDGT